MKSHILLREDSLDLTSWPVLLQHIKEWMEDAKRIAVAGYRQVPEDGKDVCDSASDAEHSDHGEELTGMFMSDVVGSDVIPNLTSARLTAEQTNMLSATAKAHVREKLMAIQTTRTPTPVPSDADEDKMTEDQKRGIRRSILEQQSASTGRMMLNTGNTCCGL
jgi:hypothetical protein